MKPASGYELSSAADTDLEEIFDYSDETFGFEQAVNYLLELEGVFNAIVQNPEIGKTRSEVKKELRSFVKSSHIIFYRIDDQKIRIVRVLHSSRDVPKWID